jgi:hypothetical protein
MRRDLAPPTGAVPPPQYRAAAEEIARRHFALHPEELERYGEHAMAWCIHDNQYILAWAGEPHIDFDKEITWLASVLGSRGYPLSSLADDLEIAAEVAPELSERLLAGAALVRDM